MQHRQMQYSSLVLIIFIVFSGIISKAQITLSHNTNNQLLSDANLYSCDGGMRWARTFVLEDFGINTNEDYSITSGDMGIFGVSCSTQI